MDKKKVGIVTFHTADNYGAVLQAYALQAYITSLGFDVKIIDFNTPSHEKEHHVFKKAPDPLRAIAYSFFTALHYFALKKRVDRFAEFRNLYLNLTKHKYDSEKDFITNMEHFDYYITGSDQVFNPLVEYSNCYYLGFVKGSGKKIAYAPSFGLSAFSEEHSLKIKKLVSDFDSLSCREIDGANFLSKLTGLEVPNVCDPVFLLSKEEWKKIIPVSDKRKKYIFVYSLNGGANLIQLARKVSAANGNIEIVCATTDTRKYYAGISVVRSLGPLELLSYISNAEIVVTDSFHGTSLSFIFEKKVLSYIALKRAASRIESIANTLGVTDQLVYDIDSFNWGTISFAKYTNQLLEFSDSSKQYLIKTLFN